ncbi:MULTISPECIES: AfsR/SARP family transcriptional regulator [unclassified Streptomyces]|uniref:AfsR/SARP family transcriptional regulator n=1 Tax=unclassified Streptomyces TaxID=2593676 RepID=UPI002E7709F6|nr:MULTISPECIES: AfsR/SARP family transcriptional regulator [unclassified Streptomyces]MEE1758268.1 AfsR/SARP family transcriptional regulator [Streptomyces sp. SP18BB07]MEE1832676.1 AfsR/SARP family transcriptional regulator [Streptomyces sp. SP17KL33]
MEFGVLGPLEARVHGTSIVPTAGKPRQILSLLAIRVGRVVQVETLMAEVWGDAIPRSAATTLQTYILQLRRKLTAADIHQTGRGAKEILTTCYGGYRLVPEEYSCDLLAFQRLIRLGATALSADDPATATRHLGHALDLWRGPALADVPVGEVLGMEVIGMQEERARALELRLDADLRLGRHAELIGELRMLVAAQPLHETLCAQLMIALYRSGYPWRALDAFQSLRQALVEELGVEPSPRLQRLHRAILSNDAQLDAPSFTPHALTASA